MPREITRSSSINHLAGNSLSALRQGADDHPIMMLGAIVSAVFIWAFVPTEETSARLRYDIKAPVRAIHDVSTTRKSSRLPAHHGERTCEGQAWGGESLECLAMIARENVNAEGKIRVIVAAIPDGLNTPNIF